MNGCDALAPHTRRYQFGGILCGRIICNGHTKSSNDGQCNEQFWRSDATVIHDDYATGCREQSAQQQRTRCHRFASNTILQCEQYQARREYGGCTQREHDERWDAQIFDIPGNGIVAQRDDHAAGRERRRELDPTYDAHGRWINTYDLKNRISVFRRNRFVLNRPSSPGFLAFEFCCFSIWLRWWARKLSIVSLSRTFPLNRATRR